MTNSDAAAADFGSLLPFLSDLIRETSERPPRKTAKRRTDREDRVLGDYRLHQFGRETSRRRRPWQVRIFSVRGRNPTARSPSIERYGSSPAAPFVPTPSFPTSRPPSIPPSARSRRARRLSICFYGRYRRRPPSLECSGEMATSRLKMEWEGVPAA